jgi:aryl-alcohol dehydrogenase-like predicted oxidoreductase
LFHNEGANITFDCFFDYLVCWFRRFDEAKSKIISKKENREMNDMLYTENGKFGKLSVIGLGCWNFGAQWNNKVSEADAIQIIRFAIDNGVNFVDVAESYGFPDGQCEILLGKALLDGYRSKVKIVSKIGWYGRREADFGVSRSKYVRRMANILYNKIFKYKEFDVLKRSPELLRLCGHACCGRLQTPYIDLLLCHDDNPQDMDSFIKAFRILKAEGFIRHYGISTNRINVLKRFQEKSGNECSACECDYSLLNRSAEKEIFPYCQNNKITILTRGALARGLLSGKYNLQTVFNEPSRMSWNVGGSERSNYESYIKKINAIKQNLKTEVVTPYAYKFVFSNEHSPAVVLGSTTLDQIKQNIEIATSRLSEENFKLLTSI